MKITKLLFATSMAMLMGACSNDVEPTKPTVEPTPGADVQFGVNLDEEPGSRTIYGDYDETDKNYPILWVSGDQVKVMANNCQIDQGLYGVNLGKDTPDGHQAGELVKIGNAGVQWGDAPTADFFSVYPANHVTEMNADTRTVKCHFIHNQNDTIHYENNKVTVKADMKAGFLYAATYGAKNGESVNLLYKPVSTGLRFTLNGPTEGSVQIQRVILTAPEGQDIAGDFEIQFPANAGTTENPTTPTITPTGNNYNFINILAPYDQSGSGFIELGAGQSIELNAFLLLDKEVTLDDNWSIGVILSNGKRFIKYLGNATTADNKKTLVPGKIHRLAASALPALNLPSGSADYDPANWMVNIARNTYLSEISIPGSWNTLNTAFQADTSLVNQYKAGCRAFHLDARWNATRTASLFPTYTLTTLGVANGGTAWDASGGNCATDGKAMGNQASATFESYLNRICNQVKPDEYMIILATFAQNSATKKGETWEKAISDICAKNAKIADAKTITATTTVGKVLGKVIVIIETEGAVPTIPDSKCFFVEAPLKQKSSYYNPLGSYKKNLLNWGTGASGLTLATSQCQVEFQSHSTYTSQGDDNSERGYLPTPAARKAQAQAIMDWSEANYVSNKANEIFTNWLYLSLGGYRGAYGIRSTVGEVSSSQAAVAKDYNLWMQNDIIGKMSTTSASGTTGFYPVGIVLMNHVTNATYGVPVMNAILQLNNRFPLGFNKNEEAWPSNQSVNFESVAEGYGSGLKVDPDNEAI